MPLLQIFVLIIIGLFCRMIYVRSKGIEYPEDVELTKEETDGDFIWNYEYIGTRYKTITLTNAKTGQKMTAESIEGEIIFKDNAGNEIPELRQPAPTYNYGGVQLAMKKYLSREVKTEWQPVKSLANHKIDFKPLTKTEQEKIYGGWRKRIATLPMGKQPINH